MFDDIDDDTKINLIPVGLLRKIKKFDKDCYILTLDKANKEDIKGFIKGKKIIKIKK